MAYRLPTFNLTFNVYRCATRYLYPQLPPTAVPVFGGLQGALVAPKRVWEYTFFPPVLSQFFSPAPMQLLMPPHFDVRGLECAGTGTPDTVEVPAGSGRFYACLYVDDIGKGYANEHRYAIITAFLNSWPTPVP